MVDAMSGVFVITHRVCSTVGLGSIISQLQGQSLLIKKPFKYFQGTQSRPLWYCKNSQAHNS